MTDADHLPEYRAEWRRCKAAMDQDDWAVIRRYLGEHPHACPSLLVISLRVARLKGLAHGIACLRAWIEE